MSIEYIALAKENKPDTVTTLLVGETPPSRGISYMYMPTAFIAQNSIASVIFEHYFGRKPDTKEEYRKFLEILKNNGIFQMDICNLPLKITNHSYVGGIHPEQFEILISHLPLLQPKILSLGIEIPEEQIIFLTHYSKTRRHIKRYFRNSPIISWDVFRSTREILL